MCGIYGLVQKVRNVDSSYVFKTLSLLSESRGKEASGFAVVKDSQIRVFKLALPSSELVRTKVFRNEILTERNNKNSFIGMGHSRLVTNGYEHYGINNQPFMKNGFVVIHNGIIVNQAKLWEKYGTSLKLSDLDSELIPTIISAELLNLNDIGKALGKLFSEIYGMTNIALLSEHFDNLILGTNNGSIYYLDNSRVFIFASEKYILQKLVIKQKLIDSENNICQLYPGECFSFNLHDFTGGKFNIGESIGNLGLCSEDRKIIHLKEEIDRKIYINSSLSHNSFIVPENIIKISGERREAIYKLRRCTKCILPETFPFISFDKNGVCNYCNNYKRHERKHETELKDIALRHMNNDKNPECLIPFSGGRDSSYALHYVVKHLGLKPIAFSYDWGMITDLARRNQARMCAKLGVEHILVSADIRKKRDNIRKNVLAWLKKPSLGTVPLFMAGDKQYFYYANLLMKQNNLELSILGENLLETTNFKSGFCGIKPKFDKHNTYSLSMRDRIKMVSFYGSEFIKNPAYLNSSLLDTLDAFRSYYVIKHNNINIYDFIKWDEELITSTLLNEYEWEIDPGTKTTWRIGDGTASFYNFIYYMVAGFTENDTFRSNQVREGDIIREDALKLSDLENQIRWDSLIWYAETINIDVEYAINQILKQEPLWVE